MYEQLTNCPNCTRHLSGKCPNFTLCFPEKIFSGIFFFGGGLWGRATPLLPSPTPMAGPQAPHQLNPALMLSDVRSIQHNNTTPLVRMLFFWNFTTGQTGSNMFCRISQNCEWVFRLHFLYGQGGHPTLFWNMNDEIWHLWPFKIGGVGDKHPTTPTTPSVNNTFTVAMFHELEKKMVHDTTSHRDGASNSNTLFLHFQSWLNLRYPFSHRVYSIITYFILIYVDLFKIYAYQCVHVYFRSVSCL